MHEIRIGDFLKDKFLISRDSARELERHLATAADGGAERAPAEATLSIDFEGVQGVSPSFVDELLRVIEPLLRSRADGQGFRLVIRRPPTRLSSKFEAVARGHSMRAVALPDGSWMLQGISSAAA